MYSPFKQHEDGQVIDELILLIALFLVMFGFVTLQVWNVISLKMHENACPARSVKTLKRVMTKSARARVSRRFARRQRQRKTKKVSGFKINRLCSCIFDPPTRTNMVLVLYTNKSISYIHTPRYTTLKVWRMARAVGKAEKTWRRPRNSQLSFARPCWSAGWTGMPQSQTPRSPQKADLRTLLSLK